MNRGVGKQTLVPFELTTNMTLIFKSCFHSSGILWQKPDHPLYVQIDWTQVGGGCYAVVDPMDSGHILYLSERSYQIQVRVSMTQDYPLIVLARAGDRRLVVPQSPVEKPVSGETSKDGTSGDPDPDTTETSPKPKNTPLPLRLPVEPAFPYVPKGDRHTSDSIRRDTYQAIQRWIAQYLAWKKLYQQILQRNAESVSMSVQRVSDIHPPEIRHSPSKRSWRRLLNWPLSPLGSFKSKAVKDRRESVVTLTEVNLLSLIFHWGLDSSFRLGGPLTAPESLKDDLSSLGLALVKILRASGPQAVIMKMKNTCFFLDRWLADKSAPRDSWMLGVPVSLSRSGLPKLIPQRWRRAISSGNRNVVRLARTILKAYTAFEGTHAPQTLATITEAEPELEQTTLSDFEEFCSKVFWPKVIAEYSRENGKKGLLQPRTSYEYMEKPHGSYAAGPNGGPSVLKRHLDTLAWYQQGDKALLEYLECAEEYGTRNAYGKDYKRIQSLVAEQSHSPESDNFVEDIIFDEAVLSLGRVHLLKEPAGKVRTIAIVDYWTQRALSPLHNWMADVLSVLPGDCTFDQEGGLSSFQRELLRARQEHVWSVDLKSATDLIPISLYRAVFKSILPNGLTDKWLALLRDRRFLVLPQEKGLLDFRVIKPGRSVKYGRGQPMGALTSWPSMAIVHHALVLYCANSVGEDPRGFSLYRVLGDDVVIGDEPTASAYSAKCSALRVPISLHKTISGRLHTFASQAVLQNDNVSHLSLVEELGVSSYTQRLELALRAARRGWLDWSRKSLGGFLRHLLSRKDYKSSVKEFAKGRLGTMAQAALVQSLTVAGSALAKLDVSSVGSGPFLLALANKVTALSPNSNDLARKRWDNFDEIQICLALRTLYNIQGELSDNIAKYDRNWALLKALVIGLQVEPQKTIHDWFGLGGPKRNSRLPFVWDAEILVETLLEHYAHASLEQNLPIPGSNYRRYAKAWVPVDKKSRFDAVKKCLHSRIALLLEVDGSSTFKMQSVDPWRLVDEVFAELAKIPRLPDFTSYDDFVAGNQPTIGADRMKRQWVRATSAYAEMMRFCNVQTNFIISFADLSEVQTESDLVTSSLAALPNPQLFEAFSARWKKDREQSRSGHQGPRPRNAPRTRTLTPKGS